ncbi:hypothetical protein EZV73_23505 [Acidaminobacter sp. JC074]|uniref:aminotransferase class IV n=1 Tax=Acidaminobacter sp. JC074 TaxID=2530199 RepID=UPI001F0EB6FF|nr:aminotransferase class IV [Acidaminobacter sp. JC074]MCH4890568.1 hypothetical protein [Acidaminobacter sp. JC074]
MAYSLGLKFGYGLFETIYYNGHLEDFDRHMRRLNESLIKLNMSPVDCDEVLKNALLHLEPSGHNAIRISVYQDKDQVITYETRNHIQKESYDVKFSSIKRHSSQPLFQLKSTCHLSYFLEKQSLKDYDEALHFNEKGHLTEGIYTNVFFVKSGIFYTPAVDCGILPGIYREKVIETLKKLGIPIKIGYYNREDIESADEVFMTNALIKIMPVRRLEGQTFKEDLYTKLLIKEML